MPHAEIKEEFGLGASAPRRDRLRTLAPDDDIATAYDRQHLSLYAALLDAEDAGRDWQEAAITLMSLDVTVVGAEACWRSHLERARWIVGEGLAAALGAFGPVSGRAA